MAANQRFVNGAKSVAQVGQITYATYDVTTTYGVLIGSKAITQIGTGGTITATVSALLLLLQASTEPEYLEYTWSANAGVLTYTNKTAGKSGTVTGTVSGGTGTQTPAAVTANSGPSVFDIAANWSTLVPVVTDTIYLDNSTVPLLYDLSQAGFTLAAGVIAQSFEAAIGLPKFNGDAQPYTEYRPDYLALDCSLWTIGLGPGRGSGRIKINSGSVQTAVNIFNSGTPLEFDLESILWKGTHASNVVNVSGAASVGVAVFGSETAVIATLIVNDRARVRCGSGTTLTTVQVNGGTLEVNAAIGTKLTVLGGTVTINGTGAIAGLEVRGGRVNYNSTGALGGTPIVSGSGYLDFNGDPRAKAVSGTINLYGTRARVRDTNKAVASLVCKFNQGAKANQVDWGDDFTLTRT